MQDTHSQLRIKETGQENKKREREYKKTSLSRDTSTSRRTIRRRSIERDLNRKGVESRWPGSRNGLVRCNSFIWNSTTQRFGEMRKKKHKKEPKAGWSEVRRQYYTNLGPWWHDGNRGFGWMGWSTPGIDPSGRSAAANIDI